MAISTTPVRTALPTSNVGMAFGPPMKVRRRVPRPSWLARSIQLSSRLTRATRLMADSSVRIDDVALEPERVLRELEIHAEVVGTDRLHRGHDGGHRLVVKGLGHRLHEARTRSWPRARGAPRAASDRGQVRDASGGVRRKAPGGQQAAVVEDDVGEVGRAVASQGGQGAEVHEDRAVAVEDDHAVQRAVEGDARARARRRAPWRAAGRRRSRDARGRRAPARWRP